MLWLSQTFSQTANEKPIFLQQRSSSWFVTTAIGIGIFTDSFSYAIIVPILPYCMQYQCGIKTSNIQFWTCAMIAVYGATILLTSPVVGWVADNTKSRRIPYIAGLLVLLFATLLISFGRNVLVLMMARGLQGISATMVWVVGLAMLVDTVGKENVGRAMGFAALGSSCAILAGPMVGGILLERFSWHSVFYICFAFIGVDLVMRILMIEESTTRQWSEDSPPNPAAGSASILSSSASTAVPRPLSKFRSIFSLFKSARLLCAILSTVVSAMLISAFDAIIPLHVQETYGWGPSAGGLVFAAVIIPNFISPLIGWLCDRYNSKWIVSAGYICFCPLLVCLRLTMENDLLHKILFCGLLAGIGLSYGLVIVPILSEYTHVVDEKEKACPGIFGRQGAYAQAYGMYNIAFSAGLLLGPLWGALLMSKYGWQELTLSLGLLCVFTGVIFAIWGGQRSYNLRLDTGSVDAIANDV